MKDNFKIWLISFLICLSVLVLINIVSAQDIFKANKEIDYKKPCINNGTYCSASAICNLTIIYPNSSVLVNNQPMTNQLYYHNYTISPQVELGTYTANMVCSDGGLLGAETLYLDITPTGTITSTGQAIIYFIVLAISLIILLFLIYSSVTIPYRNERNQYDEIIKVNWKKYLKMFCITLSYIMLVWIVYISWNISYGYLDLREASQIFRVLFTLLLGLFFPMVLTMGIFLLISYTSDKKINEYIKRGMPIS